MVVSVGSQMSSPTRILSYAGLHVAPFFMEIAPALQMSTHVLQPVQSSAQITARPSFMVMA